MALTAKQRRFVEEYLIDLNATKAAERAGYSAKTANEQGAQLLGNAKIQAAIGAAEEERSERTAVTQDRVLREVAAMAFINLAALFKGGTLLPIHALPDE